MKTMFTVTLFLLLTKSLFAPEYITLVIFEATPVNPYEPIIKAVVQIESANGKYLFNAKENAVGHFGIRPIRLDDYNKRTGQNIKLSDCYDYATGRRIFLHYASQIDYRDIKGICISWNGKSKENRYYNKIRAEMLKNVKM